MDLKSKVEYSRLSWGITIAVTVLLVACLIPAYHEPSAFIILLIVLLILYISALFFAPIAISADEKEVKVHAKLNSLSIPVGKIAKVERYRPLPGTIRTCASGGFMGFWGLFHDPVIKSFTGFWGKKDDCFLITLNDGKKYLLGCQNPDEILNFIKTRIPQSN